MVWLKLRYILLIDFQPDVVHTHSGKAGLLGRCAAHRLGVSAIVHTIHGAPFHAYQGRVGRALFRGCDVYAARRCHAMISVEDAMKLIVSGGAFLPGKHGDLPPQLAGFEEV